MYLISACLCGINCRYNSSNSYNEICSKLMIENKAIPVCPEQLGGLSTPRTPCELQGTANEVIEGENRIIDSDGIDVTEMFLRGANEVLKLSKMLNVKKAILKEGSPSCGVNFVYDGTFEGRKILGMGITSQILSDASIEVLSENDLGGIYRGDI